MDQPKTPIDRVGDRPSTWPSTTAIIASVRQQLSTLTDDQEELADARERLLLEREGFRSRIKDMRDQINRSGDAEVAFMNTVREFVNTQSSSLPPALTAAYRKVEEERDKLGLKEAAILQYEENLTGSEWTFHEQENDFYQYKLLELIPDDLFDDLQPIAESEPQPAQPDSAQPSRIEQYEAAIAEHDWLIQQFDDLRLVQSHFLDKSSNAESESNATIQGLDRSDHEIRFKALLTQISDCEVRIDQHKAALMQQVGPLSSIPRRNSADAAPLLKPQTAWTFDTISQARSDGALQDSLQDLPIKQRIREWLLDYLKSNPLEKTQYLNILKDNLVFTGSHLQFHDNFSFWRNEATQYWYSDISEQLGRHDVPLPSASHHSSQRQDADLGSTTSSRVRLEKPLSSPPVIKPDLDFEANFNYDPVPILNPETQDPGPVGIVGPTVLVDPPEDAPLENGNEKAQDQVRSLPTPEGTFREPLAPIDTNIPRPEIGEGTGASTMFITDPHADRLEAPVSPRHDSHHNSDDESFHQVTSVIPHSENRASLHGQALSPQSPQSNINHMDAGTEELQQTVSPPLETGLLLQSPRQPLEDFHTKESPAIGSSNLTEDHHRMSREKANITTFTDSASKSYAPRHYSRDQPDLSKPSLSLICRPLAYDHRQIAFDIWGRAHSRSLV